MTTPPRVFVSYSHDGADHKQWVQDLAADLRRNGVDASLDQWDLRPGQDTTFFMESQIRDSDFVILVCTPTYAEKSNIPRGGVGYEKNIISAAMLQASDLNPKFLPVLRKGDFEKSLPTYLGSRYAIDFRDDARRAMALDELLRAIHGAPPPTKPPLGPNPFTVLEQGPVPVEGRSKAKSERTDDSKPDETKSQFIRVDGDIDAWEKISLGRFEFLRSSKLSKNLANPFGKGFWQGSFVLQGELKALSLPEFLEVLRKSKTGLTGWDIGWVPTKESIAPYPFKSGIEVWLGEQGGKGAGHSDFWRAEPIGAFALFRGYQEDDADFRKTYPNIDLDYSLVIWRVAEYLLYLKKFASHMGVSPTTRAMVKFRWTGLEGRNIGMHKSFFRNDRYVGRESIVESSLPILDTSTIDKTLIQYVHNITRSLFESFDFFSINRDQVEEILAGLLHPKKKILT